MKEQNQLLLDQLALLWVCRSLRRIVSNSTWGTVCVCRQRRLLLLLREQRRRHYVRRRDVLPGGVLLRRLWLRVCHLQVHPLALGTLLGHLHHGPSSDIGVRLGCGVPRGQVDRAGLQLWLLLPGPARPSSTPR